MKRYLLPGLILVAGIVIAILQWSDGDRVVAVVALVLAAGLAWWFWRLLRRGPHVALDQVPADDVVVFWKPGCIYCVRLLERFDSQTGISWVNIHQDPAAAALVREHNDGNELTPTVRTRTGEMLSNPSPDEVARLIANG